MEVGFFCLFLFFYSKGSEALKQVAQRGCGCPLSGGIQSQAGWDFEQPGLEGGVPAYSRGLELGDLKGPFQPKPKPFYDSMILLTTRGPRDQMLVVILLPWSKEDKRRGTFVSTPERAKEVANRNAKS